MPKAEAGTPKAIGNAIKAKGLQKLMFFCQCCQKQCRDANGFKCHAMSEAHQRQLLLVADNPTKYLEEYSKEFLKDFMQLFRTQYGCRRVFANEIYQDYIKDRYHVHMNSTKWLTLGAFVQWLGKHGYATVDRSEKGWYVTYIDRDPVVVARQDNLLRREKVEKDYEERQARTIEEQVERGRQLERERCAGDRPAEAAEPAGDQQLHRDPEQKIVLSLRLAGAPKKGDTQAVASTSASRAASSSEAATNPESTGGESSKRVKPESTGGESAKRVKSESTSRESTKRAKREKSPPRKRSALDEIMEEEKRKRATDCDDSLVGKGDDSWLSADIVVKVTSAQVPEKYRMKKGHVERVEGGYLAYVRMLDSAALLKLDQKHLETVIPREGNLVRVLRGVGRSADGTLLRVDLDELSADVRLESGSQKGRLLKRLPFDAICKIHKP